MVPLHDTHSFLALSVLWTCSARSHFYSKANCSNSTTLPCQRFYFSALSPFHTQFRSQPSNGVGFFFPFLRCIVCLAGVNRYFKATKALYRRRRRYFLQFGVDTQFLTSVHICQENCSQSIWRFKNYKIVCFCQFVIIVIKFKSLGLFD